MTDHQKPMPDKPSDNELLSPLEALRGSVPFNIDPIEPVGVDVWEALRD
ncbi:hypothetical protein [Caballeronia sp. INDeC2]|nr:hypothetical protein [Caballeronia sp. INDeC2]